MKDKYILGILGLFIYLGIFSVNGALIDNVSVYFSFDNNTYDLSNHGYNFTNNGATLNSTGKLGQAYTYNNVSGNYLNTSYQFNSGQNYSISVWVNLPSFSNNQAILSNAFYNGAIFEGFLMYDQNNNGKVAVDINGKEVNSTSAISFNSWQHIIYTQNQSTQKLYLNGNLIDTETTLTNFTNTRKLLIGRNNDSTFPRYIKGSIDELGIWNKTLTSSEILELYNGGSGNSYTNFSSSSSLSFSSISLTNNTYFNTSNIQINTTVLNTSTNGNVNQTAYLYHNNGSFINSTQYATNNLNGTLNYNSLIDDIYKIYFYAKNNETNVTSSNYTFTRDTINPWINLSFPSTINNNSLNLSLINYINISDTNSYSCSITITEQGQSPVYQSNCSTATYIFNDLGDASVYVNVTDIAGNSNSSNATINIDLYRVTVNFISSFSGDSITGVTLNTTYLNGTSFNNQTSGSNSYIIVYMNPNNYSFRGQVSTFDISYLNFTKSSINISESINLSFTSIFTFYLKDERTLGTFNLTPVSLATLQIVCEDESVIQQTINSTSFSINVPCSIQKFKFILDYTSDSYFRSILIDESEKNRSVYLIDLTTTQSVFNTFTLFDISSEYINPRLSFKKYIGTELLEITGDRVDVQGKVPTYLILNDEYILELSSDNKPTRSLGFYSADIPGDKILKLFDLNFTVDIQNKDNVYLYTYLTNGTIYGIFNDTTSTTNIVVFTIKNGTRYGNILFQDQITGDSVGAFSYNVPLNYSNTSLYTLLNLTNDYDIYYLAKIVRNDSSITTGLINLTNISMDWVITIFLGFLLLTLTITTASVGGMIILLVAAFFVKLGWFTLTWGAIALGLLLSILKILNEEEKK